MEKIEKKSNRRVMNLFGGESTLKRFRFSKPSAGVLYGETSVKVPMKVYKNRNVSTLALLRNNFITFR